MNARPLLLCLLVGCAPSGFLPGPDGGTVCSDDGVACVTIPGALDFAITVEPYEGALPGAALQPVYDFGPDGATFDDPVTVRLQFDPAEHDAGLTMGWLEGAEFFALDDFAVDYEAGVATGTTDHFTPYLLVFGGDADGDGHSVPQDCDDTDPTIHPGAPEVADGLDNDCDGLIDEGVVNTCIDQIDNDGDGWVDLDDPDCSYDPAGNVVGDEVGLSQRECNDGLDNDGDGRVDSWDLDCVNGWGTSEAGVVLIDNDGDGWQAPADCDDNDPTVYPGAPELIDGLDNDCDGIVDEVSTDCIDGADNDQDGWIDLDDPDCSFDPATGLVFGSEIGFGLTVCNDGVDNDMDGAADAADPGCSDALDGDEGPNSPMDLDGDGFDASVDCDDTDPTAYPGAPELLDGIDNDCDGVVDNGVGDCGDGLDNDGDGWVDLDDPDCTLSPLGNPLGVELGFGPWDCNDGIDNDGDGFSDADDADCTAATDNDESMVVVVDADGDGWPIPADCDDNDPAINPGAIEVVDGLDNDCDGLIDEQTSNCMDGIDNDQDGWIDLDDWDCVVPFFASEMGYGQTACNDAVDNDGDGLIDAADPGCTDGTDATE